MHKKGGIKLSVVRRKSMTDQIYELIRNDILSQNFKSGEKISIRDLEQRYEVSQTPIREALNRLQQDGLVEYKPNFGASIISIDKKDVVEILQVHAALDRAAVKFAMNSTDNAGMLDELSYHAQMHKKYLYESDTNKYMFHSNEFHNVFYRYANNERLNKLMTQIRSQYEVLFSRYISRVANKEKAVEEHYEIFEAVKNKDVNKACELIELHQLNAIDRLVESEK